MKRYIALAAMLAAATLHAATVTIDVQVDQSKIVMPPAEKAAFCGVTAPTCPDPGVPPSPPPPSIPPPGGQPACATNYTKLDWNGTALERRGLSGPFRPDGVWVIEFRTGDVPATLGNLPKITAAEHNSSPSTRTAVLSDQPCDFSGTALGLGSTSVSNSVTVVFSVQTTAGFFTPTLKRNTTYYFNVKNSPGSTCSASESQECSMFVDLIKPSGL